MVADARPSTRDGRREHIWIRSDAGRPGWLASLPHHRANPVAAFERTTASGEPQPAHRILVVLDGSASARAGLAEAVRIAHESHGRLTIAQLVRPAPWWALVNPTAPFTRDDLRAAYVNEAEQALAWARESVPGGVSLTTLLLAGRPTPALAREVDAGDYDIVIARPTRRVRRIARSAPVPVLVVPAR